MTTAPGTTGVRLARVTDAPLSVDEHLEACLGHGVDGVLRAAVDLAVAALSAEAARLAHGHAGDVEGLEGGADVVDLERLDDGGDELHG